MRIALIDPSMFSWPYDRELALGLQAYGSDVIVIGSHGSEEATSDCPFYSPHYHGGLFGRAMRVVPRLPSRLMQGISHCIGTLGLVHRLKEFHPDVIHFQWLPLPIVDIRAMRELRKVAPIVLTIHNSLPFNGDQNSRLQSLGWEEAISQSARIIVHTESAATRALRQGVPGERLDIIPHGLLSKPVQGNYREGLPFDLLMFGKLRPYKGLDVFVAALEQIPPAVRKVLRVRIIGRPYFDLGPLIQRLKNAGFDGSSLELRSEFIDESEIQEIFAAASAVIMPYRAVDASGILSLAIAHGRPVIGTNIDGLAEAVQHGSEALLVPTEDPTALAKAIERFVLDKNLPRHLRFGMLAKRNGIPTWEKIASMTMDTYSRALRERLPS